MSEENTTAEDAGQNEYSDDQLPDWAREKITKANKEAAKYRTEKKDAVEAAKAEVTEEFNSRIEKLEAEIAEKEAEHGNTRTEVAKLKAAIQAGVANDKVFSFAEILKGDSPDELASHAEELKRLFTTDEQPKNNSSATDPSQGSGNSIPLNGDPLLNAVTSIVNR